MERLSDKYATLLKQVKGLVSATLKYSELCVQCIIDHMPETFEKEDLTAFGTLNQTVGTLKTTHQSLQSPIYDQAVLHTLAKQAATGLRDAHTSLTQSVYTLYDNHESIKSAMQENIALCTAQIKETPTEKPLESFLKDLPKYIGKVEEILYPKEKELGIGVTQELEKKKPTRISDFFSDKTKTPTHTNTR